jgi:hypothetical protein
MKSGIQPSSIAMINQLSDQEKLEIYSRFIPEELRNRFGLSPDFTDPEGRSLLEIRGRPGTVDVIVSLKHQFEADDPLLYVHLADNINGQIHVLLYVVNDPESERFDVDRMPDGTETAFGTFRRNIPAEIAAYHAGLAPGQVRRGMRMLGRSIPAFEDFVSSLYHGIYFVEPLHYHNAIIFERYGFSYQKGLNFMRSIHARFLGDSDLIALLDGSTPFRTMDARSSIRGRSWAIHDGILGSPFTDVTMFKEVGRLSNICTFPDSAW